MVLLHLLPPSPHVLRPSRLVSGATDAHIRIRGTGHCRALLKEPIVQLRDGHGEEHTCLVSVVIIVEVLDHKEGLLLCLLSGEHEHQGFITQG